MACDNKLHNEAFALFSLSSEMLCIAFICSADFYCWVYNVNGSSRGEMGQCMQWDPDGWLTVDILPLLIWPPVSDSHSSESDTLGKTLWLVLFSFSISVFLSHLHPLSRQNVIVVEDSLWNYTNLDLSPATFFFFLVVFLCDFKWTGFFFFFKFVFSFTWCSVLYLFGQK